MYFLNIYHSLTLSTFKYFSQMSNFNHKNTDNFWSTQFCFDQNNIMICPRKKWLAASTTGTTRPCLRTHQSTGWGKVSISSIKFFPCNGSGSDYIQLISWLALNILNRSISNKSTHFLRFWYLTRSIRENLYNWST